jgi:hypothetical protein
MWDCSKVIIIKKDNANNAQGISHHFAQKTP